MEEIEISTSKELAESYGRGVEIAKNKIYQAQCDLKNCKSILSNDSLDQKELIQFSNQLTSHRMRLRRLFVMYAANRLGQLLVQAAMTSYEEPDETVEYIVENIQNSKPNDEVFTLASEIQKEIQDKYPPAEYPTYKPISCLKQNLDSFTVDS